MNRSPQVMDPKTPLEISHDVGMLLQDQIEHMDECERCPASAVAVLLTKVQFFLLGFGSRLILFMRCEL